MLVPLLDGKVTVGERARIANRLVRAQIKNREHAVVALVTSDDPWLRSCGAYAIGNFGLKSLEGELNRCLNDTVPAAARNRQNSQTALGGAGYEGLKVKSVKRVSLECEAGGRGEDFRLQNVAQKGRLLP